MKRINALIAVLISICFTACKPITPSGMEKAFGCAVGKTTIEEFCNLFPESSIERVLRWTLGDPTAFLRGGPPDYVAKLEIVGNDSLAILRGGEPDWSGKLYRSEELSIIVTEGSYYGNDYQHIRMSFDNGVLTEIGFDAYGSADEIDNMIAFFREEFSQYYDYDLETPASMAGMDHLQVFFNDGLTTIMLWRRDWSQSEPSEYNPTTEIELEIQIMNTQMKKDWIKTVSQKRSKKVRRK
jgi:hypothetical protein